MEALGIMEVNTESEQLKATINVRALISAYENQVTNPIRQRSRSLGNLLPKNVIVKSNDFKTLYDVSRLLHVIEKSLNAYKIYDKQKHVTLQEELFNILTSIINIDNDDPVEAKSLIAKTKSFVSLLNNKLPSNTVTNRYQTFVSYTSETNNKQNGTPKLSSVEREFKSSKSVEIVKTNESDEVDNIKQIISVKKLKEKFQGDHVPKENSNTNISKNRYITQKSLVISGLNNGAKNNSQSKTNLNFKENSISIPVTKAEEKSEVIPVNSITSVSVQQLRNLFETRSKENTLGLPLVLKEEKPPITRFNYKLKMADETNEEDLKNIEVSSYLKSANNDSNRLLEILNKERGLHYDLKINDDAEDKEKIDHVEEINYSVPMFRLEFAENGDDNKSKLPEDSDSDSNSNLEYENGEVNDDNDEWSSNTSSEDTVKSSDSIKNAVTRVESVSERNSVSLEDAQS